MAITPDALLGHGNAGATLSASITTSAAAAAGSVIVVGAGRFDSVTGDDMTLAGGGLTWTRVLDVQNGTLRIAVWTAPAPAGLASSSTITVTLGGTGDVMLSARSYNGCSATPNGLNNTGVGTAQAWATGNVAAAAGDALVGFAFIDGLVGSSTASGSNVEFDDFNIAGQTETFTGVEQASVAGTTTAAGSWSSASGATWICGAVELVAAAGGGSGRAVSPLLMKMTAFWNNNVLGFPAPAPGPPVVAGNPDNPHTVVTPRTTYY